MQQSRSNLFTMKAFQSFESFKTSQQKHDVEDALEAFLVDQRMAFYDLIKFREPQEHNEISLSARVFDTNEIERWFLKIEKDLQTILENPTIELSFTKTESNQNLDEVQTILNEVSKDFDQLSVEAQLQYMVAKNKLSNLKHGGN